MIWASLSLAVLNVSQIQIKLRWALFVTYTIIQSIMRSEMCSLHLTHLEQWAADCAAPGEQSWTSCRSRDSNPQPWVTSGFKSNALSSRPRLPRTVHTTDVFAALVRASIWSRNVIVRYKLFGLFTYSAEHRNSFFFFFFLAEQFQLPNIRCIPTFFCSVH